MDMTMGERISAVRRVLEKHIGGKLYTDELYQGRNALPDPLLKLIETHALINAHADLRRKFASEEDATSYFNKGKLIPTDMAVAPVMSFSDREKPQDAGESLITYAEHVAHTAASKGLP
jgi:hypothetical protein